MVIAKLDDGLPCPKYHSKSDGILMVIEPVGGIAFALLVMIPSLYIAVIHLLFKELRTLFGKLLIFYNLFSVYRYQYYSPYNNTLLDNSKFTNDMPHCHDMLYDVLYRERVICNNHFNSFSLPHVSFLLAEIRNE